MGNKKTMAKCECGGLINTISRAILLTETLVYKDMSMIAYGEETVGASRFQGYECNDCSKTWANAGELLKYLRKLHKKTMKKKARK